MNRVAEDGIAAHWLYKENGDRGMIPQDDRALTWLRTSSNGKKTLTDSTEFYEFFKIDLFHAEIFIFTPKGDSFPFPKEQR